MRAFGSLLAAHMKRLGINQVELARRLGVHKTMVNKLLLGKSATNWRRAEHWATALDLTGDERREFIESMHLAASSPLVRQIVKRLESQARQPHQ